MVVALLVLAAKFARKYAWNPADATEDNAEPLPFGDSMVNLMWTVAELGFTGREIEALLRDVLKNVSRKRRKGTMGTSAVSLCERITQAFPQALRSTGNGR